jgi:hypothetical protein
VEAAGVEPADQPEASARGAEAESLKINVLLILLPKMQSHTMPRDTSPSLKRLSFRRDPPRLKGYAHLYRFGRSEETRPLLIYVGGSTSPSKYLARWSTEPTPIIAELEAALETEPLRPLDVLICPCPMDTGGEGLDGFVDHFEDELLPEIGTRPSALACIGYSAGAAYAMHLAIVEEAPAIVSIGGTGVLEAATHNRTILDRLIRDGEPGPAVGLFRNDRDQTAALESLGRNMPRPLRVVATIGGTGGHELRGQRVGSRWIPVPSRAPALSCSAVAQPGRLATDLESVVRGPLPKLASRWPS